MLKQAEEDEKKFADDFDKAKSEAQAAFQEEIAKVKTESTSNVRQQEQEIAAVKQHGHSNA